MLPKTVVNTVGWTDSKRNTGFLAAKKEKRIANQLCFKNRKIEEKPQKAFMGFDGFGRRFRSGQMDGQEAEDWIFC